MRCCIDGFNQLLSAVYRPDQQANSGLYAG